MRTVENTGNVLLIGSDLLTASVAVCLADAGHAVNVYTQSPDDFSERFNQHVQSQHRFLHKDPSGQLTVENHLNNNKDYQMVILLTPEDIKSKRDALKSIAPVVKEDTIVAINTESISLTDLSAGFAKPGQMIGLNWTEPAHTTFFLEIIHTDQSLEAAQAVNDLAKKYWGKDPYLVKNNGIRGRLIAAMAREASFLVDNDYATVDDIDRACRNDAGYYLPFCGNLRYMDLMGTYAYGMVMKDLNPDLSKDSELPGFMKTLIDNGAQGMQNRQGFYEYSEADVQKWNDTMAIFSYQIQDIIEKYPFNYTKKKTFTD